MQIIVLLSNALAYNFINILGTEIKCPSGTNSDNGFSPGCGGRNVFNNSFHENLSVLF